MVPWLPKQSFIASYSGDPGFVRGGTPAPEGILKPIIFQNCCRKLHENERIWTEGGREEGARDWQPPWIRHLAMPQ